MERVMVIPGILLENAAKAIEREKKEPDASSPFRRSPQTFAAIRMDCTPESDLMQLSVNEKE